MIRDCRVSLPPALSPRLFPYPLRSRVADLVAIGRSKVMLLGMSENSPLGGVGRALTGVRGGAIARG